ncbi:hypothetical protein NL676_002886 [Syzygium grande]|nr:hypothetical protein NL676_002886 [Syzygium grande]
MISGPKLNNFLNVGPSNLIANSTTCFRRKEVLVVAGQDRQGRASVAYISFKSVTVPPREETVELAEGL